jgi:hypothetical protein
MKIKKLDNNVLRIDVRDNTLFLKISESSIEMASGDGQHSVSMHENRFTSQKNISGELEKYVI